MEDLARRVDAAVRIAERGTSAEIVPVLAAASGNYRVPQVVSGVAFALASLAAAVLYRPEPAGDWAYEPALWWYAAPLVGGFLAGFVLARLVPSIKRAFTPRRCMRREVESAAREALDRFRVRRTKGGTGVVIYVSAFERMVRIEGDAAIAATDFDWSGVCETVVAELKAGRLAEAFEAGIERAGAMLALAFPIEPDDTDELHNGLRVLD